MGKKFVRKNRKEFVIEFISLKSRSSGKRGVKVFSSKKNCKYSQISSDSDTEWLP